MIYIPYEYTLNCMIKEQIKLKEISKKQYIQLLKDTTNKTREIYINALLKDKYE